MKNSQLKIEFEQSLSYADAGLNDDLIIERALAILDSRLRKAGAAMSSPIAVRDYLRLQLAGLEHEVFCVLFLDSQHRVIQFEEMFRGTLNQASVYPREIVKQALAHNAAAVILAHNHPSGVATPSMADRNLTNALRDALALVDVRVLDHFVVGGKDMVSFVENGLL